MRFVALLENRAMIKVCCSHVSIALVFAHVRFLRDSKRQEETQNFRVLKNNEMYLYHWARKYRPLTLSSRQMISVLYESAIYLQVKKTGELFL